MSKEQVVLVNKKDEVLGTMEKIEAHEKGLLHRAFSVFIVNQKGEIMLQQRAASKYHSPLLWTNTCCSHQRLNESSVAAGKRRLQEEMGFSVPLEEVHSFIYKTEFDNGLTEHEYDHILVGNYDGEPKLNIDEAASWKWMAPKDIEAAINEKPEEFTVWFKIIFKEYQHHLKGNTV